MAAVGDMRANCRFNRKHFLSSRRCNWINVILLNRGTVTLISDIYLGTSKKKKKNRKHSTMYNIHDTITYKEVLVKF